MTVVDKLVSKSLKKLEKHDVFDIMRELNQEFLVKLKP
jgi:hypothetical protein